MNSDELESKESNKDSIDKVASDCPVTASDEAGLSDELTSQFDAADAAFERANNVFDNYVKSIKSKTARAQAMAKCVASNGYATLSGYQENKPAPFVNINGEKALSFLKQHTSPKENTDTKVKEYKIRGHYSDRGIKGRHYATHSEKQIAMLHHSNDDHKPMGVTLDQCGDCREAFQAFAYHNDATLIVRDPSFYRVYKPSGMVDVYDTDRKLVYTTKVDEDGYVEPPSASTVSAHYTGRPW